MSLPTTVLPFASRYASVHGHSVHFTEWGSGEDVIVMWHGLARTGRDFDTPGLYYALKGCGRPLLDRSWLSLVPHRFRVICPDTIGRGMSSWSSDPDKEVGACRLRDPGASHHGRPRAALTPDAPQYQIPFYAELAKALLDALGVDKVLWVGTSMGGAIGMFAAAGPLKGRIMRLVMNDIGPALNPVAVERIRSYVTSTVEFDSVEAVEKALRLVYKPFGALTDEEWRTMADSSSRRLPSGKFALHYDPAVMKAFAEGVTAFDMWESFEGVECPAMVLRGADSDLLMEETVTAMKDRKPECVVGGVGGWWEGGRSR